MKKTLLFGMLLTPYALAQVQTYTSRSAWLAAVAAPTTIDFGKAAPVTSGGYRSYPNPGITLSGVTFSSNVPGGIVSVTSQNFCCATYRRGFDQLVSNYNGTGISISLPSGISAFGFDLFSVVSGNDAGTNQDSVDVTVAGQKYVIRTPAAPATVFVGFVSSTPISNVTIIPEQTNGGTEANLMNFSFSGGPAQSITVFSSANHQSPTIAPASLVSITGNGGLSFNPPSASVSVTDSLGQQFDLPLLSVSSNQIDAALPETLASGLVTFTVTPAIGANPVSAAAHAAPVAPGILTANGSGQGVASALVTTTRADGTVTIAPAYICLTPTNCTALPIVISDRAVVTLYGSGIRGASALNGVAVSIGGAAAVVLSAGSQGDYPWLDQVSFQLPATLEGAGIVNLLLTVDGEAANTVTLRLN